MLITSPHVAYEYFRQRIVADVEEFWALALNSEKELLMCSCLFRGTVDNCLVHPRDVFRFALFNNASSLIVAHNHPTGQPLPSDADIEITKQLLSAATLMQIPLIDHLILARGRYFSFLRSGTIEELSKDPASPDDPSPDRY